MNYIKRFNESIENKNYYEIDLEYIDTSKFNQVPIFMSNSIKKILIDRIKYNCIYDEHNFNEESWGILKTIPIDKMLSPITKEYLTFRENKCVVSILEMNDKWFRVDFYISFRKKL